MHPKQSYVSAMMWVLLSTLLWTLIFAAAKFVDGSIGVFQITFLRYVGAWAVLLSLLSVQEKGAAIRSNQPWVHFLRAITGCSAAIAITWASANMPLVDATAFGLLYGVLAVLLGAIFLGEVLSKQHVVAIVVSLAGVIIIMVSRGVFQEGLSVFPALAALASAVLFAVEGLLISVLGRSERAFSVMFYVTFFGLLLMSMPAAFEWQSIGWREIVFCLLLGPAGIFAQYCTIRGYRSAPLSVVAPVDYSWLFFSVVLGALVFQEVPGLPVLIGCAAIFAGGLLLARLEKQGT